VRLAPVRVIWLVLPLLAGPAASHALDGWDDAPRIVATVVLWAAWGTGLVALLAPRPVGLTIVRTIAPAFAALAIAGAIWDEASTLTALGAVASALTAAVLVADPAVAVASANGIAYGDELRHPLRTPPALYLGPIPAARALVVGGTVAGPLLLADGQLAWGLVALVAGLVLASLALRSLQTLARRWLILVPAGLVVLDPMTLADPVLIVRRQLRALREVDATGPLDAGALDLRLGATLGSVEVVLDRSLDVVRRGGRGRGGDTVHPASMVVAVAAPRALIDASSARRRVRGQAAMPPPSSASPS
jgi:hypothetical protein